jgi:hypothetical protein
VVREGDDGMVVFGTVVLQALVISVNLKVCDLASGLRAAGGEGLRLEPEV